MVMKLSAMLYPDLPGGELKCTICDEKFKTQLELTEHKHMKHGTTK